jgi:hypothetical protein
MKSALALAGMALTWILAAVWSPDSGWLHALGLLAAAFSTAFLLPQEEQ